MFLDQLGHVGLVGVGADGGHKPVRVFDAVVAPGHLVVPNLIDAPGVEVALDLTGLGVHQGALQSVGVALVAAGLATGVVGDPEAAGVRIEGLGTRFRRLLGHPLVRRLSGQAPRVAAVTDHAALRITLERTQGPDGGAPSIPRLPADRLPNCQDRQLACSL